MMITHNLEDRNKHQNIQKNDRSGKILQNDNDKRFKALIIFNNE